MIKGLLGWIGRNDLFVVLVVTSVMAFALVRTGALRERGRWQGAQTTATAVATSRKAVTETAAGQARVRVGVETDEKLADLQRRYDALRRRMRGAPGGASRADLPGVAGAAGQADGAACADLAVLQAANDDLARRLVDASEEGDRYRAQLMGWQAWWPQVEAAWALGDKVAAKPPG